MQPLPLRPVFALLNSYLDGLAQRQRKLLLLRLGRLVGADDPLHQRMAHHIAILEVAGQCADRNFPDWDNLLYLNNQL